ncbi:ElaB/YgaM/YqjD family protein [Chitinimonas naiadis]
MTETNTVAPNGDMKSLVTDAQTLFHGATALAGEKAVEVRDNGMHLLDTAISSLNEVQQGAETRGKAIAVSADSYVKENPWRIIAAAAGIGLVVGVLIARK